MRLKRMSAILCAVLCVFWLLPQGAHAARPESATAEEWEVLKRTNRERAANGLESLTIFPALQDAAGIRAVETETQFSHTRPNGTDCFTAIKEAGIQYRSAAENIAAGQTTPAQAVNGWMNSEGHRRNILTAGFSHLGTGHSHNRTNNWVQLFVGGCTTTAIRIEGKQPQFDAAGTLLSKDSVLAVDCDLHGTAYLPLENADYTHNGNTFTVNYNGFSATLPSDSGFSDVSSDAWYADEIHYVTQQGLMNGVGNGRFDPDGAMSRAMVVTVLHRMEGTPAAGSAGFDDVPAGTWYTAAVNWAAENGIVNGIGNDLFSPDRSITRQEFVTILYRYAQKTEADTSTLQNLHTFSDADQVADWGKTAMRWAIAKGIIEGIREGSSTRLDPEGNATRAQSAAILMRYKNTL